MKKMIVLAGTALVGLTMNAQRLDVGVNVMLGLPMGDYGVGNGNIQSSMTPSLGLGGGLEANYWINDALSVGLEVGYISFGKKSNEFPGSTVDSKGSVVPLILKGQYHFLEDEFRPYVGLGIGYGLFSRQVVAVGSTSWKQNGLLVSPRLGAMYQLNDKLALNLALQYNLMLNAVEGDLEVTVKQGGEENTFSTPDNNNDATNYLGVNLGVLITLFD